MVELSPEDWDVARPRHILALMQDGQISAAAQEAKQANQKTRKVPPAVLLYQARIAALQGRFEDADKSLAKAAQFIKIPAATQREINLRRMQTAAAAHPDDPELLLAYARVRGDALMLLQAQRLPDARRELAEVVKNTHAKGQTEDLGLMMPMQSIYFGPKRRFISGYSVPEGAADNVILDCLDDLSGNPKNALAWANIGGAMVQLSVPRMALSALSRAAALDSSLLEVRYYRGLALRELGDRAAAEKEL